METQTDKDNAFSDADLMKSLSKSDFTGINDCLGRLDTRMDTFLAVRSEVGAKMNRVNYRKAGGGYQLQPPDAAKQSGRYRRSRNDDELKNSAECISSLLSIGSQIIRPSLVDFLK